MKKFDIRTKQERARRKMHPELFNPHTLQAHTASFVAKRREGKRKAKETR